MKRLRVSLTIRDTQTRGLEYTTNLLVKCRRWLDVKFGDTRHENIHHGDIHHDDNRHGVFAGGLVWTRRLQTSSKRRYLIGE